MLSAMLEKIMGACPYKSPTDMGVNMAGNCIFDDEAVSEAARQEIIRRYYTALCGRRKGITEDSVVYKLELLMKQAGVTQEDRAVVRPALQKAEDTGEPAAAMELPDGTIVTGRTSELLGPSSALLLNALKALGGIEDSIHMISPTIIEPIQKLKVGALGNKNPRLHTDEVLIALSICAASDPYARRAMDQLPRLRGCEAHSTVILTHVDESIFRRLGVNITYEPEYQTSKLYHV